MLAAVALWREHGVVATVLGSAAGVFLLGGLLLPTRIGPLQDAWMALARGISRITTPIVMGIIYFFVITPMGLLRRNLGRHPLRRPLHDGSYWVTRPESASDLKRQF